MKAAFLLFLFGTAVAQIAPPDQKLFSSQAPVLVEMSDGANASYELGMRFTSTAAGQIKVIRFYKSAAETETHTGKIYSSSGALPASVIFSGATSGWRQQALAAPLNINANTEYTVRVYSGNTYYMSSNNGLATQLTSGNLKSMVSDNGVYGPVGSRPTSSYLNSNYLCDVVFIAACSAPTSKFKVRDRVQAFRQVNVRASGSLNGTLLGKQPSAVMGTLIAGPTSANGIAWRRIDYDSGVDGFSGEDKLAAAPSPTPTPATAPAPAPDPSSCNGAPNTPGGPDAFGGCFPGPSNTGVPAATKLTTYNGTCDIRTDNVVLDSVTINCSLLIYAKNLTIRNSVVNGYIMTNAPGASVTVQDTTVNGADSYVGVVDGDNVTVIRSNISGGEHSVHCGSNCVVRDSYLHDQWDGAAAGWHQNGFLSNGGSNNTIVHNSIGCVGACTADIAFLLNDNQSHATVDKNLLLAAPNSAFCSYPGPVSTSKSAISAFMTWTNNVFQRGANKKCGFYGPIYDWVSQTTNPNKEGYQNVWSGNKWDDGRALNP